MNHVTYWLRWLAVLPGAVIGALLLTFPLHLFLRNSLSFIEPYPELPERILSPLVIAAGFVSLGAKIAPSRKIEVAVVLFGLWMVILGGAISFVYFVGQIEGREVYAYGGGVAPVMAFIGGIIGFMIVRNNTKDDRSKANNG